MRLVLKNIIYLWACFLNRPETVCFLVFWLNSILTSLTGSTWTERVHSQAGVRTFKLTDRVHFLVLNHLSVKNHDVFSLTLSCKKKPKKIQRDWNMIKAWVTSYMIKVKTKRPYEKVKDDISAAKLLQGIKETLFTSDPAGWTLTFLIQHQRSSYRPAASSPSCWARGFLTSDGPDPPRWARHQTAQPSERFPREPPRSFPYKQNPRLRSPLYYKNREQSNKGKTSKQTKWCMNVSRGWGGGNNRD